MDIKNSIWGKMNDEHYNKLLKYWQDADKKHLASLIQEVYDFGMIFTWSDEILSKKNNRVAYLSAEPIYGDNDFHMKHLSYYPRNGHSYYMSPEIQKIVEKYNCYLDWYDTGIVVVGYKSNIWS
jgi:serine/threonine protein kinase